MNFEVDHKVNDPVLAKLGKVAELRMLQQQQSDQIKPFPTCVSPKEVQVI